jgi:hypothetical protein
MSIIELVTQISDYEQPTFRLLSAILNVENLITAEDNLEFEIKRAQDKGDILLAVANDNVIYLEKLDTEFLISMNKINLAQELSLINHLSLPEQTLAYMKQLCNSKRTKPSKSEIAAFHNYDEILQQLDLITLDQSVLTLDVGNILHVPRDEYLMCDNTIKDIAESQLPDIRRDLLLANKKNDNLFIATLTNKLAETKKLGHVAFQNLLTPQSLSASLLFDKGSEQFLCEIDRCKLKTVVQIESIKLNYIAENVRWNQMQQKENVGCFFHLYTHGEKKYLLDTALLIIETKGDAQQYHIEAAENWFRSIVTDLSIDFPIKMDRQEYPDFLIVFKKTLNTIKSNISDPKKAIENFVYNYDEDCPQGNQSYLSPVYLNSIFPRIREQLIPFKLESASTKQTVEFINSLLEDLDVQSEVISGSTILNATYERNKEALGRSEIKNDYLELQRQNVKLVLQSNQLKKANDLHSANQTNEKIVTEKFQIEKQQLIDDFNLEVRKKKELDQRYALLKEQFKQEKQQLVEQLDNFVNTEQKAKIQYESLQIRFNDEKEKLTINIKAQQDKIQEQYVDLNTQFETEKTILNEKLKITESEQQTKNKGLLLTVDKLRQDNTLYQETLKQKILHQEESDETNRVSSEKYKTEKQQLLDSFAVEVRKKQELDNNYRLLNDKFKKEKQQLVETLDTAQINQEQLQTQNQSLKIQFEAEKHKLILYTQAQEQKLQEQYVVLSQKLEDEKTIKVNDPILQSDEEKLAAQDGIVRIHRLQLQAEMLAAELQGSKQNLTKQQYQEINHLLANTERQILEIQQAHNQQFRKKLENNLGKEDSLQFKVDKLSSDTQSLVEEPKYDQELQIFKSRADAFDRQLSDDQIVNKLRRGIMRDVEESTVQNWSQIQQSIHEVFEPENFTLQNAEKSIMDIINQGATKEFMMQLRLPTQLNETIQLLSQTQPTKAKVEQIQNIIVDLKTYCRNHSDPDKYLCEQGLPLFELQLDITETLLKTVSKKKALALVNDPTLDNMKILKNSTVPILNTKLEQAVQQLTATIKQPHTATIRNKVNVQFLNHIIDSMRKCRGNYKSSLCAINEREYILYFQKVLENEKILVRRKNSVCYEDRWLPEYQLRSEDEILKRYGDQVLIRRKMKKCSKIIQIYGKNIRLQDVIVE